MFFILVLRFVKEKLFRMLGDVVFMVVVFFFIDLGVGIGFMIGMGILFVDINIILIVIDKFYI